jgi:KaiC/GvpD/RAD55 family RecA-like ATPase
MPDQDERTSLPPSRKYLKTGVPNLDGLLDMDDPQKAAPGGILLSEEGCGEESTPPVTLISGEAGTGKTTIVLQMAWNLAFKERKDVYLYSLEQYTAELDLACRHFGFSAHLKKYVSPLLDLADQALPTQPDGRIKLCHFSPLPLGATEEVSTFEERFLQLSHVLDQTKKPEGSPERIFFLDSLNALGSGELRRHDIHRLFALFRTHEIPAIVTCEGGPENSSRIDSLYLAARFLADIVIDLHKDVRQEYLLFDLEIAKNRRSRQALGRHLYKTRTAVNARRQNLPHGGISVYPSIHAVLSTARERTSNKDANSKSMYQLTAGAPDSELRPILQKDYILPGACVAVTGPRGTHKRALALNLATGCTGKLSKPGKFARENPHLLVLSFGVYGGFEFSGTAWFKERKPWHGLKKQKGSDPSEVKAWERKFTARGGKGDTDPMATVLTFQVGNLAPEECFDRVEKCILDHHFSAVLLSDTAEICTGFPLLRNDPLFLPTLIDLVHSHDLVFVGVGVDGAGKFTEEMDASLLAVADYRVTLSHYPSTYELSRAIVEQSVAPQQPHPKGPVLRHLDEQVACVVVDNVSGQHYGRAPLWLWVKGTAKELHSGDIDQYWKDRPRMPYR